MGTRNLTDVFTLMRNNANHARNIFNDHAHDRTALVESGEMLEFNKTILPPPWINVLEEAQFQISRIEKKINDLASLQQAYLLKPSLDETTDKEVQIERLTQEITKLFGLAQRLIHQIQEQSLDSNYNQEIKLSRNVMTSLCSTLQNLSIQFRSVQSSYLNKLKSREERSNMFFNLGDQLQEDESVSQYTNESDMSMDREFELGPKFSEQQKQIILHEEDLARMASQRREDVNKIVSSIVDLNSIFKDLGRMVAEQGTVLDRIDFNIEQTQTQVKQAYQELAKADRYQRRNRKMQCILILAPATILMFILLLAVKF